MVDFTGTTGDDTQAGTSADEVFDFSQGGNDHLNGLDGNDTFLMGDEFNHHDRVDGGAGYDVLDLSGLYYPSELQLVNATLRNVEEIHLTPGSGNAYRFALADHTVRQGGHIFINGGDLDSLLQFYGNNITHGRFSVAGGNGYDTIYGGTANSERLTGGGGNDTIVGFGITTTLVDGGDGDDGLSAVASATIYGGRGDDRIGVDAQPTGLTTTLKMLSAGNGADTIVVFGDVRIVDGSLNGGGGSDSIEFFNTNILDVSEFSAATTGIETLRIPAPADFIGGSSANVLDFSTFATDYTGTLSANGGDGNDKVVAFRHVAANFSGADGNDILAGGMRDDRLYGGEGGDRLFGNDGTDVLSGDGGIDHLYGGRSSDAFQYTTVTDSSGRSHDVIVAFSVAEDRLAFGFRPDVDATVSSGTLAANAFDSDMAAAVNATALAAGHAVLFTPDSGGLAGRVYLIVDADDVAGYQANEDYVIRLANAQHLDQFSANNFI